MREGGCAGFFLFLFFLVAKYSPMDSGRHAVPAILISTGGYLAGDQLPRGYVNLLHAYLN